MSSPAAYALRVISATIPVVIAAGIPIAVAIYFSLKGDGLWSFAGACFAGAATTLLFCIYYWFFGYRHVKELSRGVPMTEYAMKAGIAMMGVVLVPFLLFGAFNEMSMQLPTLYEADLKGSTELLKDGVAHFNKEHVMIEHPGVEHVICVWPRGEGVEDGYKDVELYVRVMDPAMKKVLDAHETSKDAKLVKLKFTPSQAGDHLFLVTTGTKDVPGLHLWITDPQKKNGRRHID